MFASAVLVALTASPRVWQAGAQEQGQTSTPVPAAAGWTAPTVRVQGFTPQPEQVLAVLAIENTNSDASAGDVVFEVVALGDQGQWLGFGQSQVWLLAPGERTSTIFTVQLPDGGVVERVEARLRSWQALPHEPLIVAYAALAPGEPHRATAVVRSPFSSPVENVRVSAVAYADDGSVAGAGVSFIGTLPAGDKRAVEVPLTVSRPPARVEVFAVLTSRSTLR